MSCPAPSLLLPRSAPISLTRSSSLPSHFNEIFRCRPPHPVRQSNELAAHSCSSAIAPSHPLPSFALALFHPPSVSSLLTPRISAETHVSLWYPHRQPQFRSLPGSSWCSARSKRRRRRRRRARRRWSTRGRGGHEEAGERGRTACARDEGVEEVGGGEELEGCWWAAGGRPGEGRRRRGEGGGRGRAIFLETSNAGR